MPPKGWKKPVSLCIECGEPAPKPSLGKCARCYQRQWKREQYQRQTADGVSKRSKKKKVQDRESALLSWHKRPIEERRAKGRETRLKQKYGLTTEGALEVLTRQGGCAICQRPLVGLGHRKGFAVVDHHHGTGEVRGLLCAHCNSGLGHFQDSPEIAERAAQYLRNPPGIPQDIPRVWAKKKRKLLPNGEVSF